MRRVRDPLIEALAARLGEHGVKKASRALGAPHGTVKKWFLGQTAPSGRRVGDIFRVYGDLLADVGEESA